MVPGRTVPPVQVKIKPHQAGTLWAIKHRPAESSFLTKVGGALRAARGACSETVQRQKSQKLFLGLCLLLPETLPCLIE